MYEILGYELDVRNQQVGRFTFTGQRFPTEAEAIAAGEIARQNVYPETRSRYYRVRPVHSNRLVE
jgi:hypothetical protein